MAKTRDNYQLTGRTVDELVRNLNFLLQRLSDRIDKIEGIRGSASIESDLDMNSNRVVEVAAAVLDSDALTKEQADLTGTTPTFSSLATSTTMAVGTSLTVGTDATVSGNVYVYGDDDALIHSLE